MSSSSTSRLGLNKPNPGTGEPFSLAQWNASLDKLDDAVGGKPVTSGTRPTSPWDGQIIRETDTRRVMMYSTNTGQWDQIGMMPFLQDGVNNGSTLLTATTTEAILRTLASRIYKNGKAYDIEVRCQVNPAANLGLVLRVRKGTALAGAIVADYGRIGLTQTGVDNYFLWKASFENNTGADITTQLILTAATSASTCAIKGFTAGGFDLRITELQGPASDYNGLATIS